MDETRHGRPLAVDNKAERSSPTEPAFVARPQGAAVYHGFIVLDEIAVDGFTLGKITDWEAEPCETGDAFVIAPDGSRAGLIWEVCDKRYFDEVLRLEQTRWGVWGVSFPFPMNSRENARKNLESILPELKLRWSEWSRNSPAVTISRNEAMTKNHILIDLSASDKTSFGKEDFARQSLPQRVFSAIWAVESEVNNGGFSQYFLNSSAESASFVVKALETIGAPETAVICKRAIAAAFPAGLTQSVEAIRSAAAEFPDEVVAMLEPIGQEFFSYPHDLTDLLFAYVSQHPAEFGPLPKPDDA
jgi:hypothetical protein